MDSPTVHRSTHHRGCRPEQLEPYSGAGAVSAPRACLCPLAAQSPDGSLACHLEGKSYRPQAQIAPLPNTRAKTTKATPPLIILPRPRRSGRHKRGVKRASGMHKRGVKRASGRYRPGVHRASGKHKAQRPSGSQSSGPRRRFNKLPKPRGPTRTNDCIAGGLQGQLDNR